MINKCSIIQYNGKKAAEMTNQGNNKVKHLFKVNGTLIRRPYALDAEELKLISSISNFKSTTGKAKGHYKTSSVRGKSQLMDNLTLDRQT